MGKFVAIASNSDTFAYSSDGVSWKTTSTGILPNIDYSDISCGEDKFFVCAKNSNTALYSNDGISWYVTNDGILNREWIKTCFGNNRYLLIATNSDTFAYSNDGVRWYETNAGISGDNLNWKDVVFGNGRFVTISSGENNRVIYSLDGYYWNESEWESDDKNWNCIVWDSNNASYISLNDSDNGVGISATNYKEYIKTEAGKDWIKTPIVDGATNRWTSLSYGKNIYVAISSDITNTFAYSKDGINWTGYIAGLSNNYWYDIAVNDSKFVITGGSGSGAVALTNKFAYSLDGISWTETSIGLDMNNRRSIVWGYDKFVAVSGAGGSGTDMVAYSTDGISWSLASIGTARPRYHIEFGNGLFVTMAGNNSKVAAYSADGIQWTESTSGLSMQNWEYGCFDGNRFIFGAIRENIFAYSENGIQWTEIYAGYTDLKIENISYHSGLYVTASRGSSNCFYSTTLIDWYPSRSPLNIDNYYSIEFLHDKFVLAVHEENCFIYSVSGVENFPLPDPYSAPAEKAYRKVLSNASSIEWRNVSNTPTTLAGYGITDAASDEDLEKISQEISEVQQNIPSNVDLSNAVEAQTTYNELLTNLSIIDSIFSTLDSTIASLESVVS